MNNNPPRVSIGMAVYNGENFIKEAIESILAQTFHDFELIISDNASTDTTQAICLEFVNNDQRISYFRNEENFGAAQNHNRVLELSRGEYFKWISHDDVLAPEFLAQCVEVLDQKPLVILCYPRTMYIDEDGKPLAEYKQGHHRYSNLAADSSKVANTFRRLVNPILGDGKFHVDSPQPRVRFRSVLSNMGRCYPVFGLIHSNILKKTVSLGNYGHADGILLARLALLGRFYEIPEHLFFYRRHSQQSVAVYSKNGENDYYEFAQWWDPANKGQIMFPRWKMFSEYWQAISETPLSLYDRVCCYFDALNWLRGSWVYLVKEVMRGISQFFHLEKKYS
ncbi:MAG: glycosyltransferase family 2 protein [Symploca sp. SIO3E6]|nr:glycosyltransferase family 2 protein [Caldora sp. SIO3E6]